MCECLEAPFIKLLISSALLPLTQAATTAMTVVIFQKHLSGTKEDVEEKLIQLSAQAGQERLSVYRQHAKNVLPTFNSL